MKKLRYFNLRLSDTDREHLDELAKHYAATPADAFRLLLKRTADDLQKFEHWRGGALHVAWNETTTRVQGESVGEAELDDLIKALRRAQAARRRG